MSMYDGEVDCDISSFKAIKKFLQNELDAVDNIIIDAASAKLEIAELVIRHIVQAGGKRLRPLLHLLITKMSGYRGGHDIKIAAVVEMIHSATLLHDDVIDKSDMRRHRNTANNLWGEKVSILVGDLLLANSLSILSDSGDNKIIKVVAKAAETIVHAELKQMLYSHDIEISYEKYIEVISGKTAELFATSCISGAMLVSDSESFHKIIHKFGWNLGVMFQIIDDMLDYSSDLDVLGKNVGDDFRDGKVTLPVMIAYEKGNEEERGFWRRCFVDGKYNDDDIALARDHIVRHEVHTMVISCVDKYKRECEACLTHVKEPSLRDALNNIVNFVYKRDF